MPALLTARINKLSLNMLNKLFLAFVGNFHKAFMQKSATNIVTIYEKSNYKMTSF